MCTLRSRMLRIMHFLVTQGLSLVKQVLAAPKCCWVYGSPGSEQPKRTWTTPMSRTQNHSRPYSDKEVNIGQIPSYARCPTLVLYLISAR